MLCLVWEEPEYTVNEDGKLNGVSKNMTYLRFMILYAIIIFSLMLNGLPVIERDEDIIRSLAIHMAVCIEECKTDGGKQKCYCCCNRCKGSWISSSSYYIHQQKYFNKLQKPDQIPKFAFDENVYQKHIFQQPLYEGANLSVLDAITKHMYVFSMNHGMSKSALSDVLQCEKSSLPQPNCLPESFSEAKSIISPLLIPLQKFDACVNDCVLFRGSFEKLDKCVFCQEPRKENGKSRKRFTYMPLGPRLARWFGTSNLCKLLYSQKIENSEKICDFTDGSIYKSWFEVGGVFEGREEPLCIPLSLFTDGVNPNKHMTSQKSMWPLILTWINLPIEIRQLLGLMTLMGVIPSGIKGSEPKTLEPYLELLTDELLTLTEFPVLNSYKCAPVSVKAALLQYLCDIPAYSKLLHLSGHGALRSCPYCTEVGHYCKHLHKTIHLSSRSFLENDHHLRRSEGFAIKGSHETERPTSYSFEEELQLRSAYERKKNKSQKAKLQRQTGLKGNYTLLRLPYHDRLRQMQPDGMHTLADFVGHVFDMLTGKFDNQNTINCEKSFGRFPDAWNPDIFTSENCDELQSGNNKKKRRVEISPSLCSARMPWSLTKEQVKIADKKAQSIVYSHAEDITHGPHFSKPWTLKTMNSKLQFVTTGALEWCIKGLLPFRQENTLFLVLNLLKRMISPGLERKDLQQLQFDTHEALSLLERDFPLTLQNLTTHLIHHIVDGFEMFGPMYGRWLFPYERANGWITRQCLRKGVEESTIMETYMIYDWCVYMVLSQKFQPDKIFDGRNTLVSASQKIANNLATSFKPDLNYKVYNRKTKNPSSITEEMKHYMLKFYIHVLKINVLNCSENALEDHVSCDYIDEYGRQIKYVGGFNGARNPSVVKIPCDSGVQFGQICFFLEHCVNQIPQKWVIVDVFPLPEGEQKFYKCEKRKLYQKLFHISAISKPLVYVRNDFENRSDLWILNSD